MLNMTLPLRAGDALRPLLARAACGVSLARSAASVIVERVLDVLALLALAVVGSLVSTAMSRWLGAQAIVVAGLAVLVVVVVALLLRPALLAHIGALLARHAPGSLAAPARRISDLIDNVAADIEGRLTPSRIAAGVVVSFASLACAAAAYALVIQAARIAVPLEGIAVVLIASQLGSAVPSAPASIGVFHGIVVATLALFGVQTATGVAVAVVLHALMALLPVAVGAVATLIEGVGAITALRRTTPHDNPAS
jgi:hypothetical protein